MNTMLAKAIEYRKKVRFIQRNWRIKYQARTDMLENYAYYEAKTMIKTYKYLKVAHPAFITNNKFSQRAFLTCGCTHVINADALKTSAGALTRLNVCRENSLVSAIEYLQNSQNSR